MFIAVKAKIPNGQALSDVLDASAHLLSAVAVDGWTAAVMTFSVSTDGVTFRDLYDDQGIEVSIPVSSNKQFYLDPSYFAGVGFVRFRSGTSAAPVNQGAERTVHAIYRLERV